MHFWYTIAMKQGTLNFASLEDNLNLVADPIKKAFQHNELSNIYVAEIDPSLADTSAFCERYKIGKEVSANCVIVEAKRADKVWYAACVILATHRADVNGIVRRYLDARKISFAPMDKAITMSAMEYGGITPVGLPADWPVLVDSVVANTENVIIGSGLRKSKLLIPGKLLATLPSVVIMEITKSN